MLRTLKNREHHKSTQHNRVLHKRTLPEWTLLNRTLKETNNIAQLSTHQEHHTTEHYAANIIHLSTTLRTLYNWVLRHEHYTGEHYATNIIQLSTTPRTLYNWALRHERYTIEHYATNVIQLSTTPLTLYNWELRHEHYTIKHHATNIIQLGTTTRTLYNWALHHEHHSIAQLITCQEHHTTKLRKSSFVPLSVFRSLKLICLGKTWRVWCIIFCILIFRSLYSPSRTENCCPPILNDVKNSCNY